MHRRTFLRAFGALAMYGVVPRALVREALASGCGARNLVRLGGGNLKSLIVLVCLGLVAYMTMRGFLAPVRVHVLEPLSWEISVPQLLPHVAGRRPAHQRLDPARCLWLEVEHPAFGVAKA